nr:MAG TPA: hypothetical protein [Caudoviricetes sp.]
MSFYVIKFERIKDIIIFIYTVFALIDLILKYV